MKKIIFAAIFMGRSQPGPFNKVEFKDLGVGTNFAQVAVSPGRLIRLRLAWAVEGVTANVAVSPGRLIRLRED